MANRAELETRTGAPRPDGGKAWPEGLAPLASRFGAFVVERHPFALDDALEAYETAAAGREPSGADEIDALRGAFGRELTRRLQLRTTPSGLGETTPRVSAATRVAEAGAQLLDDCDGFLRRAAIRASLSREERVEILRGMLLTRATDNRLKTLFTSGEVRYGASAFQGKGFRSLGQEAIYAAGIRLRRGARYRRDDGAWNGDIIGPVIRDLGVTLAMRPEPDTVRMALNAQMGKLGPPLDGKDLHIGDFEWGILPPAAPLTTATLTIAGIAMAFWRDGSGRVAVSFIGEGGSKPSTCVRSAASRRFSASRTTRPRCRRRSAIRVPGACLPTKRRDTAYPGSPSTARMPTRLRRRLPGPRSAPAPAAGRR